MKKVERREGNGGRNRSACSISLYFTEKTVKMWKNRQKWPFFVIWPAGSCGGSSKGVSFVLTWAYELLLAIM